MESVISHRPEMQGDFPADHRYLYGQPVMVVLGDRANDKELDRIYGTAVFNNAFYRFEGSGDKFTVIYTKQVGYHVFLTDSIISINGTRGYIGYARTEL